MLATNTSGHHRHKCAWHRGGFGVAVRALGVDNGPGRGDVRKRPRMALRNDCVSSGEIPTETRIPISAGPGLDAGRGPFQA